LLVRLPDVQRYSSLPSSLTPTYKVRPFSACSSDTLLACALASVGQFLRLWFFKEGFSVLGRSFPFPSLLGIFPSFCQALAEDRVTTPTTKKKKKLRLLLAHHSNYRLVHSLSLYSWQKKFIMRTKIVSLQL